MTTGLTAYLGSVSILAGFLVLMGGGIDCLLKGFGKIADPIIERFENFLKRRN